MLAETIARLKDQATPPLADVAGAVEFAAALKQRRPRLPAAFVVPVAETGGKNQTVTIVQQEVSARFAVVIAVSKLGDARGGDGVEETELVRAPVRVALLGWRPTEDHGQTTFVRGRVLAFENGVVWWMDEFESHFHIRAA